MENYDKEILKAAEMIKNMDARGIDKFLFRYQEMGMGMLFSALYHALKQEPTIKSQETGDKSRDLKNQEQEQD